MHLSPSADSGHYQYLRPLPSTIFYISPNSLTKITLTHHLSFSSSPFLHRTSQTLTIVKTGTNTYHHCLHTSTADANITTPIEYYPVSTTFATTQTVTSTLLHRKPSSHSLPTTVVQPKITTQMPPTPTPPSPYDPNTERRRLDCSSPPMAMSNPLHSTTQPHDNGETHKSQPSSKKAAPNTITRWLEYARICALEAEAEEALAREGPRFAFGGG
ncbi:hypothetical protein ACFE04_005580 [Oxalis oulophora]